MEPMEEHRRRQIMEWMKWELAWELGVRPPADGYWGGISARECGRIGARLRHRMRALETGRSAGKAGGPEAPEPGGGGRGPQRD